MNIIPNSWKQRREKRKEKLRNISKDWKKAKKEFKAIPKKAKKDSEPKKKKYNSKQEYILNEIEELNKEHKKIQKSQIWLAIGAVCGFAIFFPIGIGAVIYMIINAIKMSKIRKQVKEKQREVDISFIK